MSSRSPADLLKFLLQPRYLLLVELLLGVLLGYHFLLPLSLFVVHRGNLVLQLPDLSSLLGVVMASRVASGVTFAESLFELFDLDVLLLVLFDYLIRLLLHLFNVEFELLLEPNMLSDVGL